jgi:hypothetical protein
VFSAFIDDQWRPFQQLLIRPAVRVISVSGGANYQAVEPRFGFKAFLWDDFAPTGSAGRFHQAAHSIRDQSVPITMFDFWIGADDLTPVARSNHLVLGFEQWLSRGISLTVEGFTKTYDSLLIQNDWGRLV